MSIAKEMRKNTGFVTMNDDCVSKLKSSYLQNLAAIKTSFINKYIFN